ncbi:sensor histidine kinase [Pedobacter sp. MW01-1-1]|uniref:sensor histidine kinase n=1 Tax=Pedobacter sp. MW01-1-1 TaxID=3383027 RepID=UPI003FEE036F
MKKKSFWFITVLMTLALLGVFVMQLYYIRESYNLKSQLFDEQVNKTLSDVVTKVQRFNVARHLNKKDEENKLKHYQDARQRVLDIKELRQQFAEEEDIRREERQTLIENYLNQQDSIIRAEYSIPKIISENDFKSLTSTQPSISGARLDLQMDAIVDINKYTLERYSMRSKLYSPEAKTFNFRSAQNLPDTVRYLVSDPFTGKPLLVGLPKISDDLEKRFKREDAIAKRKLDLKIASIGKDTIAYTRSRLVEDVSKELEEGDIPLNKRIDFKFIGAVLKEELLNHNIYQTPVYKIASNKNHSIVFMEVSNNKGEFLPQNTYKTPLFGNDLYRDPGTLIVSFPYKNSAILENLKAILVSSVGLLLVLVFIFSYTLYAILRQKKLSEMKSDFINNMTHEFKTPVATIMIASEALKDPEITEDKRRLQRLAGMIYDENVRLGDHIERVLSIARMEKNELEMNNAEVEMNDLILVALDSMSLQLQKRQAILHVHTDAEMATVFGDELHLSNVLYNLIDNANKYSISTPEITITTRNTDKNLIIEIADKGIGMTKEHSKRIFDQFYRVPTGNLHDVKGFGLGLNYVRDIVRKTNGSIKVHSEKDKGTRFEIILPLYIK